MARGIEKLTALRVAKLVRAGKRGRWGDGGNLYLQMVDGSASWSFRYVDANGRERWLGLGPVHDVSLADARKKARALRMMRHDGLDPVVERATRSAAKARVLTFAIAADQFVEAHGSGWRSAKHRRQWRAALRKHADPVFGALPVSAIETADVMRALQPIWLATPPTADRVRHAIERTLDWAAAQGLREGPNPARWRGHFQNLLPPPNKVRPIQHHPAMPVAELPAFVVRLREQPPTAVTAALEFVILTASRLGEVIGALWDEIDLPARVWTVPPERMKAGREHRVPLSARAIEILQGTGSSEGVVFRRPRGEPLGESALPRLLKTLAPAITTHGFRSTFRDWAGERSGFPREICEMALAHSVGNRSEQSYARSDQLHRRRLLMAAWAEFCERPIATETVVPFAPLAG